MLLNLIGWCVRRWMPFLYIPAQDQSPYECVDREGIQIDVSSEEKRVYNGKHSTILGPYLLRWRTIFGE